MEKLAAKFKTVDIKNDFKKKFEECQAASDAAPAELKVAKLNHLKFNRKKQAQFFMYLLINFLSFYVE